jgi:peptide/nickel transport system substrate-binding protein
MGSNHTARGHRIARRSVLRGAAAATGAAALARLGVGSAAAEGEAKFAVVNPKYAPLYEGNAGYYFNDAQWVKDTIPRLTWPKDGERVPELGVIIPNNEPDWIDSFRKWSADAEQLGLKYNITQVSNARWLEMINLHRHGDIEVHPSAMRPERADPAEWLVSRAYGLDRRNYGEQCNEQYDAAVEAQGHESDHAKRLAFVQEAQRVLADDYSLSVFGWGPALDEVYNSEAFDGVVQVRGFGISAFAMFHSYVNMRPKTSRKRLVVGTTSLLGTTNIIAATNTMRSVGRMIYDRLAFISPDLEPIPWAAESWQRLDDRTWDLTLRSGMQFHDGKPVTVKDLKFTFDLMLQYERGIFWSANQFLAGTEIVDEAKNILRLRFKEPYGQFETYFLQMNTILPAHIWGTIMQEQGTSDPRLVRIDKPIGSGPFSFGRYRKDSELQLVANKQHFSKPKVEDVWIVVTPSIDGLLGRLESQEIDMLDPENAALKPSQVARLAKLKHITVVKTRDINWFHGVNRISVLPWRDYAFRRAWMHSFDRDFLVNVPWEGAGRVPAANTFLVQGNPWHNPNLPPMPKFDLKLAREILAEAGYSWASDGRLLYPSAADAKFRERVTRVSKKGYRWGGLKMLD